MTEFAWNYFFGVFVVFTILLIINQRVAERHQRGFRIFIILFGALWLWWRFTLFPFEMIFGILGAIFISFLFWLLIGRYNPVGNPDDEGIVVIGLDD